MRRAKRTDHTLRFRRELVSVDTALRLLANDPHGVTEALMLAHGFRGEMLAGLVLAGLAAVTTDTMRAGAATVKVERYRITSDGRNALAD